MASLCKNTNVRGKNKRVGKLRKNLIIWPLKRFYTVPSTPDIYKSMENTFEVKGTDITRISTKILHDLITRLYRSIEIFPKDSILLF